MLVATTPAVLRSWSDQHHREGRRVGLVPTMGALHAGHVALVRRARELTDAVAVSIFVNPLQFDRPDDFAGYPRPIETDLETCRSIGVDAVYAPVAATMYPAGFDTHVTPGRIGEVLEGAHRPGHFRGVATVVAKLFGAANADVAVFGEKDFQQLAVIRRMVADLDMGVDVVGLPTVRDADGVAMSSRNGRLSTEQRAAAVCVPRSLDAVADAAAAGVVDPADLVRIARAVIEAERLARFEHLHLVHADTLEPVDAVDASAVALTAVWFGDVRLIDNRRLG